MGALADSWNEIKKQSAVKDTQINDLVSQNAALSKELEASNGAGLDAADKAALAEMEAAAGIKPTP